MANKRNTKMVLASLLATSAIVPAISASAEVGGDITRSVETTDAVTTSIEATPISAEEMVVKLSYDNPMAANILPSTGTFLDDDGAAFIVVTLENPTVVAALTSVKVDGQEVLIKSEEGNIVLLPLVGSSETITVSVESSFGAMELVVTPEFPTEEGTEETDTDEETVTDEGEEVTDEETGTDVEEGSDEETTEDTVEVTDVAPLKYAKEGYGEIADGEYPVEIDLVDLDTGETGYGLMARHLEPTATLVVEDGAYYLDIKATQSSNAMIIDYFLLEDEETLESVEGSKEEYPHTVRVPLGDINGYTEMAVHVYAEYPGGVHDSVYKFGIMVKPGQGLTEVVDTYVYKDKSNELSVMNGKYLSATSNVTLTEEGTYNVELTFPENQHVVEFIFDGETVAATTTTEDSAGNEIGIYTVEVDDLSKIYNSTIDLHVIAEIGGKPFEYKEAYDVQIQFGGEQNPFGDITKSWAYGNVVSLYNKGIFKSADKFNPSNNLERGHFALMLARAFDLEAPANTPFTDLRSDVEEQTAIKALNNYDIINGKSATTFAPADKILRYEAALMINRLLNKYDIEVNGENLRGFNDIDKVSNEANEAIVNLASLDIIGGKGDGKFDPNGTLTRAEMAKILDNALKLIEKQ